MEIKKIENNLNIDEFKKLIDNINENLKNKEYFIPICTDEILDLFDSTKSILFGCFDGEHLIGVSCLCLNMNWYKEVLKKFNISTENVGCVEHCMVNSNYRGNNIMYKLNCEIVKCAKELKLKHLVATAHPQNIASISSLTKLGMKRLATFKRDGFLRDIFIMEV